MYQTTKPFNSSVSFVPRFLNAGQAGATLWRLAGMTILSIVLVLLTGTRTLAQVQVENLEGETFQNADARQSKVSCTSDVKGGNVNFFTTGVAVGPFAGTFIESGDIQFDPITGQVLGGGLGFEIKSDKGFITGRKTPIDGEARCTVDNGTGVMTIAVRISTLEYTANIGPTTDTGRATLDLFASIDPKLGLTTLQFTEVFHSSNVVRPTFGKVTGGGNLTQGDQKAAVTFGFNAQNTENGMKGAGTIIDHNAGVKVKILDVTAFSISGTHATFSGSAEVNGVVEKYTIDVDDLGEPGGGLDSFKLVTSSYGTGGTLSGGNIQVHK
jgi:hypothetical protein